MEQRYQIGSLLYSSVQRFVFGTSVSAPQIPCFGKFVKVPIQQGSSQAYGIIYDILLPEDPLVRQAAGLRDAPPEVIFAHRQRQLPIDVSVLSLAYQQGNGIRAGLPPQPPIGLDAVSSCDDQEVIALTADYTYLRLILNSPDVPSEELLVRALQHAAEVRSTAQRQAYLLHVGQYLARVLSQDLTRLDSILRRIQIPV
jgi:hypothetical protein